MDSGYTLLAYCAVVVLMLYLISQRKPKGFPPGPWGFPILGHLPLLGLEPHKVAAAYKIKYGPILGIDFAAFPCIIISDYKLCKEAFSLNAFSGRPEVKFFADRAGGRPEGIAFSDQRTWREQLTFTHRQLRALGGFGTPSMESIILKQMHEFMDLMVNKVDHPITTYFLFNVAVVNALWAIVAGEPFKQTDPEALRAALSVVEGFAEGNMYGMLIMFIPWISDHFPDWVSGRKALEKQYVPVIKFLRPYIAEHWKSHTAGKPRDLIDAFIDEVQVTTDSESSFHISRSKHSLETTLLDLFLGSVETVATSLSWICLFMARYPEIQEKLAIEIQKVVGSGSPSLADRTSMPYTEAIIHEVMRVRPLTPLGPFHSTLENVYFHGYNIPKDTMVFINIWEAHHNKEYWGDPENFRPERWLSADGSEFERRAAFMVYSTGKRICLGEQLSRDEIFLFAVGLFQKFSVGVDPNSPLPTLEPRLGGTTLGPKEHKVIFKMRIKSCN